MSSSIIRTLCVAGMLAAASLPLASRGQAQTASPPAESWQESGPEVDVALVLAVDISYSMDMEEQRLQRDGYIAALTSPQVLDAIRRGMIGKIAVTYIEWAGMAMRNVVVDWHIIEDQKSAEAFVAQLREAPIRRARRTSVTGAIDISMERLRAAKLRPLRRVIDISGDGPNNDGPPVTRSRDRAIDAGVTINGLPIVINRGFTSSYDIEGLDSYYADCVIGGPGAFMVTVTEREQFTAAIKTKILREVAQASQNDAAPGPVQGRSDCLIGEKLWRQNWERN